jgi:hypothetical protein
MRAEIPRVADYPESIHYPSAQILGRKAARWLADREDPSRMRDSGNVIFTPHTEAEQAAWRARVAQRASRSREEEKFILRPIAAERARRRGAKAGQ